MTVKVNIILSLWAIFILCFVCFLVNELHSKDKWREAELYEVYIKNNRTVTQNYRQRQYQQNTTTQVSYILLIFFKFEYFSRFQFYKDKTTAGKQPNNSPQQDSLPSTPEDAKKQIYNHYKELKVLSCT